MIKYKTISLRPDDVEELRKVRKMVEASTGIPLSDAGVIKLLVRRFLKENSL